MERNGTGRTHAAPPAPGTHTTAREIIQDTIAAAAAAARPLGEPGPNGRAPRRPAPRAAPLPPPEPAALRVRAVPAEAERRGVSRGPPSAREQC